MKELIALLILISPLLCRSQESTSEQSRFSVGVNFSPNYSYRTLKYTDEYQALVHAREEIEHPSFGFNTGIAARYAFTEKLEVELGLQFSRQTHKFKDVSLTDATGSDLGSVDTEFRYDYLEIPLRVNYHVINKKIFCYVTAGGSINLFLDDESISSVTYSNGNTDETKSDTGILDFNKTGFSVLAGIGAGYHVSEKLNIRFEPLYRYGITPLADSPVDQHNYSIGCQIGLNLKL